MAHEITERQQAEERLQRAKGELEQYTHELEQTNEELADFLYIASHDLQEPLRGIHNYAGFLLEDYQEKLAADGRDKLATIQHLCQRLEALINDLRHFSRLGQQELGRQEIELALLLKQVVEELVASHPRSQDQVRVAAMPRLSCDPEMVAELFRNLINNGLTHNDQDDKLVEVGWQPDEQGLAVFFVRDNGIGIPQRYQERIFKIFKRLHGRERYGGGTGAGLTLGRRIVERHGGQIWLESVPGEGSTFFFTLGKGISAELLARKK